jgi:glycine/D-amino acid oxidase-like deaminating enzyme
VVTKKRKLRDGKTVWEAEALPAIPSTHAKTNHVYDVVIIGAGISGALAAEAISSVTGNVLVVDRRAPASGSTMASTALIQWEIDEPLIKLARKLGPKRARAGYMAAHKGVGRLMRRIRSNRIRCDLAPRYGLLLSGSKMGHNALKKETQLRRRLALPCKFLNQVELMRRYGFRGRTAVLSSGNCEVNPRKLTLGLLKVAIARGVQCMFPSEVRAMSATSLGVFLYLSDGTVIAGRKVIAATGYEVLPEISKQKFDLVSTWAIATKKLPEKELWKGRALIWEASEPYLYARTTFDGRIIVGGEDESFSSAARRRGKTPFKAGKIISKFAKLMPLASLHAEFAWTGTFATSPTGFPVIGEIAGLPNVFAILASGGNGITFSSIAAEMAVSWVRGKRHRYSSIFSPQA